jgi:hypothetical protein
MIGGDVLEWNCQGQTMGGTSIANISGNAAPLSGLRQ